MIKDNLIKDFLDFSLEANTRSTIHLVDGLKPVHRRILYGMNSLSKANKEYKGSAKITGDVLGALHPHSDSSVYNAAVRLAQPFKTRYPLVSFEGNLGSIAEPNGFAAARYTKMKLSPIGLELLEYLDYDTVPFAETYNGEWVEPLHLPSLFPVTLVNGTLGIGVGMSSSLPPHNLTEILNAASALIARPSLTTAELMRYVKGPDFPTGNQVINPEALLAAYETGSGSVKLRANYDIVTKNGQTSIIIKEVPFLIDPDTRIISVIREMYQEGYEYIEDIINHTGKNETFKLEIVLRRGAPVYEVIEKLHKETGIETSFTINNTIYLGNGKFKQLGLKDLLSSYINNVYDILVKVAKYDLNKAELRLEIIKGLIRAIVLIEEIIPIIKSSANNADAAKNLQAKWNFTERQVTAILDMKLSRLTNLDENKLKKEKDDLIRKISDLRAFISDKNLQTKAVLNKFENLKKKYGDTRRTVIKGAADVAEGEVGSTNIFITKDGLIASISDLPANRRNTKGKNFLPIRASIAAKADETLIVLLDDGTLTPLEVATVIGYEDPTDLSSSLGGVPVDIKRYEGESHCAILTEKGTIKKSSIEDLNLTKSLPSIKLRAEDKASQLFFTNEADIFVAIRPTNKYVAFPASDIKETSRLTIGTAAVTGGFNTLTLVREGLLLWSEGGIGKIVKKQDLSITSRQSGGLVCGDAIGGLGVFIKDTLAIQAKDSKTIFIGASTVSVLKIAAKGIKIYNGDISEIFKL